MINKLSFVIPCYGSEKTIISVVEEIETTLKQRPNYDYEIILVNDCSPDNVWEVISNRALLDDKVIGICLSKNFGQHSALMAGYNNVSGDVVVSLDDDGQTPASDVFKMIDELENGNYDIVYATYPESHKNIFRRLGSSFTRKVTDYLFDISNNKKQASSYFVAKRFIIDEIIRYKNAFPFLSGLVLRTTRNYGFVTIEHRNRLTGKSGYSFRKLFNLWFNGFTSFSIKPLKFGAQFGFVFAFAGFIFAFTTIIRKMFINPDIQAGWSSTISVIMITGGIIMMMLGLIGEYIGRIYICINNSPQYVIKDIVKKRKD